MGLETGTEPEAAKEIDTLPRGWRLSLYPEAREGGGCLAGPRGVANTGTKGAARDPERAKAEAGRRARGRLRRYCAANRLNRLATLTYGGEGCHDVREVRADIRSFFRSLRGELGGEGFPYAWVPEWHASGHGLHVHFAVGQFIRRSAIEAAWGHGFTHIKLIGDLPVGSGPLQEARVAAGYLSKYVAKSFEENPELGLHRYDLAQGFQPMKQQFGGRSADLVIDQASSVMGAAPSFRWSSREVEGWSAPPAIWVQWA